MIKIGQTSLLELPIRFLKYAFPYVKKYYGEDNRSPDSYEHIWTLPISNSLFGVLSLFSWWFMIGIFVSSFLHIVVKEIILDKPKRDSGVQHEKDAFRVDMTTRTFGFILSLIIPILILIYKISI